MASIYCNSVDNAFKDLCKMLYTRPVIESRDGPCCEMLGIHVILPGAYTQLLTNERRALSFKYAAAEMLWYLSEDMSGEMISHYAPQYKNYLDEDGNALGAYGYRLAKNKIWYNALALIHENRGSRQIVLPMFQHQDLERAVQKGKDIPCTCLWQFIVRDERLHMLVYMRSNDLWLGFPYDVFAFTEFQKFVAYGNGLDVGDYHHMVGSMHLYTRNRTAALQAVSAKTIKRYTLPSSQYNVKGKDLTKAHELEIAIRTNQLYRPDEINALPAPLDDYVLACADTAPNNEHFRFVFEQHQRRKQ